MGSGWRAGTSTAPASRRTATLVVAIVGMNESSRVFFGPMSPLPAPANAPGPTTAIVNHQMQRERVCKAGKIHRQHTAHAVKTPSIHPPRTSSAEGAVAMPNGTAAPDPSSSTMAGVARSATSDEIRHRTANITSCFQHQRRQRSSPAGVRDMSVLSIAPCSTRPPYPYMPLGVDNKIMAGTDPVGVP